MFYYDYIKVNKYLTNISETRKFFIIYQNKIDVKKYIEENELVKYSKNIQKQFEFNHSCSAYLRKNKHVSEGHFIKEIPLISFNNSKSDDYEYGEDSLIKYNNYYHYNHHICYGLDMKQFDYISGPGFTTGWYTNDEIFLLFENFKDLTLFIKTYIFNDIDECNTFSDFIKKYKNLSCLSDEIVNDYDSNAISIDDKAYIDICFDKYKIREKFNVTLNDLYPRSFEINGFDIIIRPSVLF